MKLTIEVTLEDIEQANKFRFISYNNRTEKCPIALAAKRKTGLDVCVYVDLIGFPSKPKSTLPQEVALPPEAKRFIKDFDRGLLNWPKPLSFTLEVPDELFTARKL